MNLLSKPRLVTLVSLIATGILGTRVVDQAYNSASAKVTQAQAFVNEPEPSRCESLALLDEAEKAEAATDGKATEVAAAWENQIHSIDNATADMVGQIEGNIKRLRHLRQVNGGRMPDTSMLDRCVDYVVKPSPETPASIVKLVCMLSLDFHDVDRDSAELFREDALPVLELGPTNTTYPERFKELEADLAAGIYGQIGSTFRHLDISSGTISVSGPNAESIHDSDNQTLLVDNLVRLFRGPSTSDVEWGTALAEAQALGRTCDSTTQERSSLAQDHVAILTVMPLMESLFYRSDRVKMLQQLSNIERAAYLQQAALTQFQQKLMSIGKERESTVTIIQRQIESVVGTSDVLAKLYVVGVTANRLKKLVNSEPTVAYDTVSTYRGYGGGNQPRSTYIDMGKLSEAMQHRNPTPLPSSRTR